MQHEWLKDLNSKAQQTGSWLDDLLSSPDVVPISSKGVINLGSGITLGEDHFFSALMDEGLVNSIDCWYNKRDHMFIGVFTLGEDVCGYVGPLLTLYHVHNDSILRVGLSSTYICTSTHTVIRTGTPD